MISQCPVVWRLVLLASTILAVDVSETDGFVYPSFRGRPIHEAGRYFSFCQHERRQFLRQSVVVGRSSVSADTAEEILNQDTMPLPPPPEPESNPADDLFRSIRRNVPVLIQNWMRDSGLMRILADGLVYLGLPSLVKTYPSAVRDFVRPSAPFALGTDEANGSDQNKFTKLSYGEHPMQVMHLFEPPTNRPLTGVIAFVHGGAWGSGQPWMYRLTALPFLEQNYAVAIVGYRTYPDADVDGQASDVAMALTTLAEDRPDLMCKRSGGISALIGHSSGAHISMLTLLDFEKNRLSKQLDENSVQRGSEGIFDIPINAFVGISGVYCIPTHLKYEMGRGVDEVSPMKAACGHTHENMVASSVNYRLNCILNEDFSEECMLTDEGSKSVSDRHTPKILLLHGVDDNVCPYTYTVDMSAALRSSFKCEDMILRNVGHADTVLHLMLGGKTRKVLNEWLTKNMA